MQGLATFERKRLGPEAAVPHSSLISQVLDDPGPSKEAIGGNRASGRQGLELSDLGASEPQTSGLPGTNNMRLQVQLIRGFLGVSLEKLESCQDTPPSGLKWKL